MPTTSFENNEVLLPRILEEDIYHLYVIDNLKKRMNLTDSDFDAIITNITDTSSKLEPNKRDRLLNHLSFIRSQAIRNSELILREINE